MKTLSDSDQDKEQNNYRDWLDECSEYIERALAGIFFFIFKKVPQWLWHALSKTFIRIFVEVPIKLIEWFKQSANFILRLMWAVLMLFTLVGVVFGPPISALLLHKFQLIGLAWFVLAFAGGTWGLASLRRQQIRSAFSMLLIKLRFWQTPTSPEGIQD